MDCLVCYNPVRWYSVQLEPCDHVLCRHCITSWILICERNSQSSPTCPACRRGLSMGQVLRILGRSYKPAIVLDDFTSAYLAEAGAKKCGGCGVWIIKEGGCNHMTCVVCYYEFCWDCGCRMRDCSCVAFSCGEDFWDDESCASIENFDTFTWLDAYEIYEEPMGRHVKGRSSLNGSRPHTSHRGSKRQRDSKSKKNGRSKPGARIQRKRNTLQWGCI